MLSMACCGIAIGLLVAHHHVVPLLADQHLAHGVAAHRRLDGVLYVGHVDPETSRLRGGRSVRSRFGWPKSRKSLTSCMPGNGRHDGGDFFALLLQKSSGHRRKP